MTTTNRCTWTYITNTNMFTNRFNYTDINSKNSFTCKSTTTENWTNKLIESTGKPKDLWKALRSLGLPSKTSSCDVNALKIKNTVEHNVGSVLKGFRNYYSTLADMHKNVPQANL